MNYRIPYVSFLEIERGVACDIKSIIPCEVPGFIPCIEFTEAGYDATSSKKDIQLDIYVRCSDKPLPINFVRSRNTSIRSQLDPLMTTNVSEGDCNTSICSPLED